MGWSDIFDYGLYFRGVIITLYSIFLFRANSTRIYGNHSPLDFVIYIILGAILGEAVVNNIPVISSMIVCAIIVFIHRFLVYLAYKSHWLGTYLKGEKVCIIKDGRYIEKNLRCCRLTPNDILQALRVQYSIERITTVKEAILERSGQISFIFKSKPAKEPRK